MTESAEQAVPLGLADLPLDVRQASDVQTFWEQQEGIARRHEVICAEERAQTIAAFARLLNIAPTVAAKLRGD